MAVLVFIALFLSSIGYSSATYCLCKAGGSDAAYQPTIDWACANGANCGPIQENGPCYQPNNVKSHCDYAANSYFQNKGQAPDSCNFSGTATQSSTPPTTVVSGCSYPTGPGSTTPTTGGIPSTTPGTSTGIGPGTGTGVGTGTGTGTGMGGTGTGTGTGTTGSNFPGGTYSPPGFAPIGMTDPNINGSPPLLQQHSRNFLSLFLALLLPCSLVLWG